ncbi:UDP-N-acetylmuramoyl-L-alanine--D-glutamate ligase [Candidatus Gottesmanbacteria bacterium]|nr:UDP-N-acetylmuramoyl-L-alanine--D-glutamate ligase [Candidatus Gottesmanbacteria bacterium]
MTTSEIRGSSILLLGYGRENQSVHRFLTTHYPDATIAIADQSPIAPLFPVTKVASGPEYVLGIGEYETVVRSPGIPAHLKELVAYRDSGGHVTTATNIFFSICPEVTIGVTGTKGKSTTSALIADMLKQKFSDVRLVGNIGNPMLDALEGATAEAIFIVELSSHQLEDIRYSPHVAVILNIVPEHLDYYQTFEHYIAAKKNVIAFQKADDFAVFSLQHDVVQKLAAQSNGHGHRKFSLTKAADAATWIDEEILIVREGETTHAVLPLTEIPLKGNVENILAATSVGLIFGLLPDQLRQALCSFKSLPHRLEFVGEFRGISFYNDSLATIPEATIHALTALGDDVATLIAGGFDRGLDYTALGEFLAKRKSLQTLILFPDTGEKIWTAILHIDPAPTIQKFDIASMEEAVGLAYQHTPAGKICLLSPAAASFNLFRDYAHRGEEFRKWVNALA